MNVLVYAVRAEMPEHTAVRSWLTQAIRDREPLAVCETVLSGLVRVATNPRIFQKPQSARVFDFVDVLRAARTVHFLAPDDATWARLRGLCETDAALRGSQVTDAFLAALAISHGARLATRDRGMARFDGLRFFDPIAT
ncbi:TA system VapC family ribonuclease toxin [Spongisporangium articulatum]|uniref:Ribonuclease VapC n=1 Tax=Spongisporangium articulatum TaxID=3362603 RepID=A0ABW8AQK8_9ACTN